MKLKSYLVVVLALLALFTLTASADVTVTNVSYDRDTGDFTLYVDATEPWEVWYSPAIGLPWQKVTAHPLGAGIKSWTDEGIGLRAPMGFYVAVPKSKKELPGNRYGWYYNENNPHWPVAMP